MNLRTFRRAMSVFLLLSLSSGLIASEWHVAPPPLGDDSNPGTNELPFATIQRGIDAASSGDTVIVAEGTYVEKIHFDGKNIALRSTDPLDPSLVANTVIDGNKLGSAVTFSGTETEACVLSGFTIRNGKTSGSGGGIYGGTYPVFTHATIENSTIMGNSATYNGGGLGWCGGTIQNNTITGNSADSGGGLAECGGTIQNNTITGNSADLGAGLVWCNGRVQNNTITGNSAQSFGGGLSNCYGTIQNNTITGNSATYHGGGLYLCDGAIQNNTITGNWAGRNGGGLYACSGTIQNCIIWGNTAPSGPQLHESSIPTYSCIEGWTGGGEGNIAQNPRFVSPTDYRLQLGSPCIDAGRNEKWMERATDLDGQPRIQFGGKSLTVDMGAYEFMRRDTTPPVITLMGDSSVTLEAGTAYVEPGYTATDNLDGDITAGVVVTGLVEPTVLGTYTLKYNVSDLSGNPAVEKVRTITVVDTTPPAITLLGENPMTLEAGTPYVEPGYTATDNLDGDITANVAVKGSVDHTATGSYALFYSVSDFTGHPAKQAARVVNVVDTIGPVITLLGENPMSIRLGTVYVEPGYAATDLCDGDVTASVVVTGSVDHDVVRTYLLHYNVTDYSGNPAEERLRTVKVVETTPPVITLLGANPMTLEVGTPYTEPGFTATDNYDGDMGAAVVVTGSVDHTVAGTYTLRYNVTDSSGNPAEQKTRTVSVVQARPFELLEVKIPADGMIQLIWTSRPGDTYTVWSCLDLLAPEWLEEATVASGGESTLWTDPSTTSPRKFYRIELKP